MSAAFCSLTALLCLKIQCPDKLSLVDGGFGVLLNQARKKKGYCELLSLTFASDHR
jgi:hypothetical protein